MSAGVERRGDRFYIVKDGRDVGYSDSYQAAREYVREKNR